jgi:hypothetical protein
MNERRLDFFSFFHFDDSTEYSTVVQVGGVAFAAPSFASSLRTAASRTVLVRSTPGGVKGVGGVAWVIAD